MRKEERTRNKERGNLMRKRIRREKKKYPKTSIEREEKEYTPRNF